MTETIINACHPHFQSIFFVSEVTTRRLHDKCIHFIRLLLRTVQTCFVNGNDFYNLGVDYKYRWGRLVWIGEGAVGKQGYALLNQLKYKILTGYQLLLIHRCYSHDYWSFFGRSFGEGSAPQNENGWYLAAEAAPWAHWKFFASLDMFSFPWWK